MFGLDAHWTEQKSSKIVLYLPLCLGARNLTLPPAATLTIGTVC
jgi:hypothetical protein